MSRPNVTYRFCLAAIAAVLLSSLIAGDSSAQEKSVRPGINRSFTDPDVNYFVERFEREGREVYDHRQQIIADCDFQPGMTVADIGTGTGLFTRLLAKQVGEKGHVYAVDIAKKFVLHVEAACKKEGIKNVQGLVCGATSTGLPPRSIDRAFICDTYHHFEYPRKTLRSLHQALRDGGQIVVVDFKRIEGKSSKWILGHVRAGQKTVTDEIIAAGFKLVDEPQRPYLKDSYFLRFEPKGKTN